MSEYAFQFAVLRYVHDPVTQEFLNIGVVVYSREAPYFKASISSRYSRLSDAFQSINGEDYRRVVRFIEQKVMRIHDELQTRLQQLDLFDELPPQIEIILSQVLPPDDSSLVFGGYGGGLTDDLDAELTRLYGRMVERYTEKDDAPSRSDQEVWQVYRREFERQNIIQHLSSVTIRTPTYDYEFALAWKNERYHPIEAVSLDLMYERTILDKVNRWVGRTIMLADSNEIGTLTMLLGTPEREGLQVAYQKAISNLRAKVPLHLELVEESEAAAFSEKLAQMINGQLSSS